MFTTYFLSFLALTVFLENLSTARSLRSQAQSVLAGLPGGHNELYQPSPSRPVPMKTPFKIDETIHHYSKQINGSENGYYRRSSCPAVNVLANRGYIKRSGRNITYEEIAQAARDVYNFGDDNVRNNQLQFSADLGWRAQLRRSY